MDRLTLESGLLLNSLCIRLYSCRASPAAEEREYSAPSSPVFSRRLEDGGGVEEVGRAGVLTGRTRRALSEAGGEAPPRRVGMSA